jgi:hypothetical protein
VAADFYQIVNSCLTTPSLWRWEIRCGGALFRCGTAPTNVVAVKDANAVVNT